MKFLKSPLMVIIVVIVIGVVSFFYHDNLVNVFSKQDPNSSGYQAVFLSNGQVYFGKVSENKNEYVTLEDVFYLQAGNKLQSQGDTATGSSSQLSLVKLGNELHGPEDVMHINRDQILFLEDLKTSGRVVQAIEEYKKGNEATSKN